MDIFALIMPSLYRINMYKLQYLPQGGCATPSGRSVGFFRKQIPMDAMEFVDWLAKPTFLLVLPSGCVKIAIENGTFIVDLPIKDVSLP